MPKDSNQGKPVSTSSGFAERTLQNMKHVYQDATLTAAEILSQEGALEDPKSLAELKDINLVIPQLNQVIQNLTGLNPLEELLLNDSSPTSQLRGLPVAKKAEYEINKTVIHIPKIVQELRVPTKLRREAIMAIGEEARRGGLLNYVFAKGPGFLVKNDSTSVNGIRSFLLERNYLSSDGQVPDSSTSTSTRTREATSEEHRRGGRPEGYKNIQELTTEIEFPRGKKGSALAYLKANASNDEVLKSYATEAGLGYSFKDAPEVHARIIQILTERKFLVERDITSRLISSPEETSPPPEEQLGNAPDSETKYEGTRFLLENRGIPVKSKKQTAALNYAVEVARGDEFLKAHSRPKSHGFQYQDTPKVILRFTEILRAGGYLADQTEQPTDSTPERMPAHPQAHPPSLLKPDKPLIAPPPSVNTLPYSPVRISIDTSMPTEFIDKYKVDILKVSGEPGSEVYDPVNLKTLTQEWNGERGITFRRDH